MRWILIGVVGLSACGPVLSTGVSGTVAGISFPRPTAAFTTRPSALGCAADDASVIYLADSEICGRTSPTNALFEADAVFSQGRRVPSLVISAGAAPSVRLDTGTRFIYADSAEVQLTSSSEQEVEGRFTARFGAETYQGTFIAGHCGGINAGCTAAGQLWPLGVVLLVLRRRGGAARREK